MKEKKRRSSLTINELRQDFVNTIALSRSGHTVMAYAHDLIVFCDWIEGQRKIKNPEKITTGHVMDFLAHVKSGGAAEASIRRLCSSLKSFWKHMLRYGHIDKDIMQVIESPRVEQKVPVIPSEIIIKQMLEQATGNKPKSLRDRALMELCYSSGLRVSELCELQIEDFNLGKREATVVMGKGNKTRTVPITERACYWIERYISEWRTTDEGYLFLSMLRGRLSKDTVGKIVETYSKKMGLKNFSTHTFRHACATHLLAKGADLSLIQKVLGHTSIISTQRYMHLSSLEINNKFQALNGT